LRLDDDGGGNDDDDETGTEVALLPAFDLRFCRAAERIRAPVTSKKSIMPTMHITTRMTTIDRICVMTLVVAERAAHSQVRLLIVFACLTAFRERRMFENKAFFRKRRSAISQSLKRCAGANPQNRIKGQEESVSCRNRVERRKATNQQNKAKQQN
jgi:hypothetical protein